MIDLERRYETLLLESPADGVVQVTLNRPDRLNAMTVTDVRRAGIGRARGRR